MYARCFFCFLPKTHRKMIAPTHNVATFDMALSAKYNIQKCGSGLTVKSSQFHNNEEISTLYIYDGIQRPKHIINCDGDTISYTYDMLDRTTQVSHPASGTISITYDPAGNMLTRETANLADTDLYIRYFYTYSRLDSISYPQHPENNVVYLYGGQNAENGRRCRLWGYKDATGAVEYSYGNMGEIVEECRSVVTKGFIMPGDLRYKNLEDYKLE